MHFGITNLYRFFSTFNEKGKKYGRKLTYFVIPRVDSPFIVGHSPGEGLRATPFSSWAGALAKD